MPFIDGFCGFFRGEMVQKWPIWGHHTQKHRFYGIKTGGSIPGQEILDCENPCFLGNKYTEDIRT